MTARPHNHALYTPVGATDIDPPQLTAYGHFVRRESDRLFETRSEDLGWLSEIAGEALLWDPDYSNPIGRALLHLIRSGSDDAALGRQLRQDILRRLHERCEDDAIDAWDGEPPLPAPRAQTAVHLGIVR